MPKMNKLSAAEKLAIILELETGQISLKAIAKKYIVDLTTLRECRNRYQLYST